MIDICNKKKKHDSIEILCCQISDVRRYRKQKDEIENKEKNHHKNTKKSYLHYFPLKTYFKTYFAISLLLNLPCWNPSFP